MDHSGMIQIVCYAGGTCGDLISALIDDRGAELNITNGTVSLPHHRAKLKKPHLFESNSDKDQYIQSIIPGTSISSHDLDYHISRQHQFIGITVQDFNIAMWAARRFKALHRPHVWKEMQDHCGATIIEQYAQILIDYSRMLVEKTNRIVTLEDIVSNRAISSLNDRLKIKLSPIAQDFYQQWLDLQKFI